MTAFVVLDNREIVITSAGARAPTHYQQIHYFKVMLPSYSKANNYATATKVLNAQ